MALEALCRIRVSKPSREKSENATVPALEPKQPLAAISTLGEPDADAVPHMTLLKWIEAISQMFFKRPEMTDESYIRDWDLEVHLDGSVQNHANNQAEPRKTVTQPEKFYPVRYRLPLVIWNRLDTNSDKIQRAELFALGSILYELIAWKPLFGDMGSGWGDEEEIISRITKGDFPEDLWTLPMAVRILACWCPSFAKKMLDAHRKGIVPELFANYVKKRPVLFGLQCVGGIATVASIFALPILGAVGFTAAGPLPGSAAAAWQSGIGIVRAGSLFAWCQSAAMGGAAVGGILVTGLAGGGIAVGATVAGALDDKDAGGLPDLKVQFLSAWRKDVSGEATS